MSALGCVVALTCSRSFYMAHLSLRPIKTSPLPSRLLPVNNKQQIHTEERFIFMCLHVN